MLLKSVFVSPSLRILGSRYFSSKKMVTKLDAIPTLFEKYGVAESILSKVSLWEGDITKIEVDAIVNAANSALAGGGGVDGAIHRAAGWSDLQKELKKFGRCPVGEAVVTSACGIEHVKKIIHAVGPAVRDSDGPSDEDEDMLKSCYLNSLRLLLEEGLRTIAFCCISTGIYGYPNDDAAYLVGNTIAKFLKRNGDKVDRIVICTFLPVDEEHYSEFFKEYVRHIRLRKAAILEEERKKNPTPNKPKDPSMPKIDETSSTKSSEEVDAENSGDAGSKEEQEEAEDGKQGSGDNAEAEDGAKDKKKKSE